MKEHISNLTVELTTVKADLDIVTTELTSLKEDVNNKICEQKIAREVSSTHDTSGVHGDNHELTLIASIQANDVPEVRETPSTFSYLQHIRDASPNTNSLRTSMGMQSTRQVARSSLLLGEMSNRIEHGELKQDLFTLMMFSSVKSHPISIHFSMSRNEDTRLYGISKPWMLGLVAFAVEFLLAAFIILDQLFNITSIEGCLVAGNSHIISMTNCFRMLPAYNENNFFQVPLNPNRFVTVAQAFAIPLALITQTELMTSMRTMYQLSYRHNKSWHSTVGVKENNRRKCVWFIRIFIPNFLQFVVTVFILFASCIIIVQSDNIVDLLKEFSAVLVVSSIDDLLFFMAKNGYLGKDLFRNAKEIEVAKLDSRAKERGSGCFTKTILFLILALLYSVWGYLVHRQHKGVYFKSEFPECKEIEGWWNGIFQNHELYNDGICEGFLNNAECGYDGLDCADFSKQYPGCYGEFETQLGDGMCDLRSNTAECFWDFGDCDNYNANPNCTVFEPRYFGDGVCSHITYNTPECDHDGGDCERFNTYYPNCTAEFPFRVGDGSCDPEYNTVECGNDGGDC